MTDTPDPENTPTASWEAQLEEAAQDQTPARRHVFDAARKKTFLKALSKGNSLAAAARAANVSPKTVYNHQRDDERARDERLGHGFFPKAFEGSGMTLA